MTDTLKTAMQWILKIEGGYVDDPNDRGGETNFGISATTYPDVDIKNLTIEGATEIYSIDYWDAYRCGELNPVPGILLFDAVVQHKPRVAVRLLQEAAGAYVDGVIGPNTIAAANVGTNRDARQFMLNNIRERAMYYHAIVVSNSKQIKFLPNWYRRLPMLQQFINDAGLLETR